VTDAEKASYPVAWMCRRPCRTLVGRDFTASHPGTPLVGDTIASQLYNAKEPVTLFELQARLGHKDSATLAAVPAPQAATMRLDVIAFNRTQQPKYRHGERLGRVRSVTTCPSIRIPLCGPADTRQSGL
jgi:hypothetical protein